MVRVRASSLNPLDGKLRAGVFRRVIPLNLPAVLGFDLAGEIAALGAGVSDWRVGERVYGRMDAKGGGAHAEFAVVAAGVVDRIPPRLGFEEAASLPLAAMTAIQALQQAQLHSGERVLINGAAGGVGTSAVQVARAMGATVTGVCTGEGVRVVSTLGASTLDYGKGELAAAHERFDVILDTAFHDLTRELARVLEPRGRYISTGFSARLLIRSTLGRLWSGRRFGFVMSRADGALMRRVSELVEAGSLRPVIDSTFPLSAIAEAHARLDRGHLRGKIVIVMPAA